MLVPHRSPSDVTTRPRDNGERWGVHNFEMYGLHLAIYQLWGAQFRIARDFLRQPHLVFTPELAEGDLLAHISETD